MRAGGAITALVTPFRKGEIDGAALEDLVEWQVLSGVDGLAICTAAGEGPSLSPQERRMALDICIRTAADRIPVIAAAGTNCTESTIGLIRDAEECGARAVLVTVPYYSKPGQKGVLHHFRQVAAASNLPILIENAPARTASDLTVETLERLADLETIVAIVDSSGDIARFTGLPPGPAATLSLPVRSRRHRAFLPSRRRRRHCVGSGQSPSATRHLAAAGGLWPPYLGGACAQRQAVPATAGAGLGGGSCPAEIWAAGAAPY